MAGDAGGRRARTLLHRRRPRPGKIPSWARTVPQTLRNPLYHWTHLELKRPLGISDQLLDPDTAEEIWQRCNALLARDDFSCRGILRQMNVALVCTTDDPADTLEFHAAIAADASLHGDCPDFRGRENGTVPLGRAIKVLPTFRPDRALAAESPPALDAWVDRLAEVSQVDVGDNYFRLLDALRQRHDHFHALGCRLSDHGLETIDAVDGTAAEAAAVFTRLRRGGTVG